MSKKNETFTERTLREIRSGKLPPSVRKKRNISRIIMIVNFIIIAIILVFFNTRNPKNEYTAASVNGDGLNMRFSINTEKENKAHIFAITLLSSIDTEKTWNFEPHLATLKLSYAGELIYEDKFGKKISRISLLPGEARTFPLQIPFEIIDIYLKEKINVTKRRKTLFDLLVKSGETIKAEAELNIQNKISGLISFQHEVEK